MSVSCLREWHQSGRSAIHRTSGRMSQIRLPAAPLGDPTVGRRQMRPEEFAALYREQRSALLWLARGPRSERDRGRRRRPGGVRGGLALGGADPGRGRLRPAGVRRHGAGEAPHRRIAQKAAGAAGLVKAPTKLLRERDFRVFLLGYTTSALGTTMSNLAVAFAVIDGGGSASALGAVMTAAIVPQVVFLQPDTCWPSPPRGRRAPRSRCSPSRASDPWRGRWPTLQCPCSQSLDDGRE